MVKPFLEAEGLWDNSYDGDKKEWYTSTIDLIRDRFQMLSDFGDRGRAYFSDEFTVEQKPLKKNVLKHEGLKDAPLTSFLVVSGYCYQVFSIP